MQLLSPPAPIVYPLTCRRSPILCSTKQWRHLLSSDYRLIPPPFTRNYTSRSPPPVQ